MDKFPWKDLQIKYRRSDFDYLTHNYHEYRGSYIPMIPKKAIWEFIRKQNKHNGNVLVLDNFGGCGTTAIEARRHDIRSISVDYNPLAVMIARVKVTPLNPNTLKLKIKQFLNETNKNVIMLGKGGRVKKLIPDFPNQDKWFNKAVLNELGVIFYNILHLRRFKNSRHFSYSKFKEFLTVAFSSILIKVANSTNFNYTTDNMLPKENRYVDVYKIFKDTLNNMQKGMRNFYLKLNKKDWKISKIYCYDSRYLTRLRAIKPNSVDFAVTSPPYLNGLDYTRMHRLSFYWLFKKWEYWLKEEREIGARVKRGKEDCVENYFNDLKMCFSEVYKTLKKNACYLVVVNDTYYKKELIQTHKRLMKIAKEIGFREIKSKKILIPGHFYKDHGKEAEWLLIFRK